MTTDLETTLERLLGDALTGRPPSQAPELALSHNDSPTVQVAAAVLSCLAAHDEAGALGAAEALLGEPPLRGPLEVKLGLLAARLADKAGDAPLAARFREGLPNAAPASLPDALGEALLSPYLTGAALTEPFEELPDASLESPAFFPDAAPRYEPRYEPHFEPLSASGEEVPARTYLVPVRHLKDAESATFALYEATLADITYGGPLGRKGAGGPYADLVLEFGPDADAPLGTLEPAALGVRLVFRGSRAVDTFSAAAGTLFDVELSPFERRVYFKLRVPAVWTAAGVPLELVWANLECCVLLT